MKVITYNFILKIKKIKDTEEKYRYYEEEYKK